MGVGVHAIFISHRKLATEPASYTTMKGFIQQEILKFAAATPNYAWLNGQHA
jgi:hypothetical protein